MLVPQTSSVESKLNLDCPAQLQGKSIHRFAHVDKHGDSWPGGTAYALEIYDRYDRFRAYCLPAEILLRSDLPHYKPQDKDNGLSHADLTRLFGLKGNGAHFANTSDEMVLFVDGRFYARSDTVLPVSDLDTITRETGHSPVVFVRDYPQNKSHN